MPPIFSMTFPEALLVFESRFDEAAERYAADYAVYRLPVGDERRRRSWADLTQGLTPVGSIPVSDVAFDETRGLTIRTMGIDGFAGA